MSFLSRSLYVGLGLLLPTLGACRRETSCCATPEQLVQRLREAARGGDYAAIWELLDQQSRWSTMSTLRAQRKARALVRKHYPAQRQASELRRSQLAAKAGDAKDFFAAYAREQGFARRWRDLQGKPQPDGSAKVATMGGAGGVERFCKEAERWRYCGLRQQLELLKIRATRDLETVREGVELRGGG